MEDSNTNYLRVNKQQEPHLSTQDKGDSNSGKTERRHERKASQNIGQGA